MREAAFSPSNQTDTTAGWLFYFLPNTAYAIQLRCAETGTVITAELRWIETVRGWRGSVACSDGGCRVTRTTASWHDADRELSDLTRHMCAAQRALQVAVAETRRRAVPNG